MPFEQGLAMLRDGFLPAGRGGMLTPAELLPTAPDGCDPESTRVAARQSLVCLEQVLARNFNAAIRTGERALRPAVGAAEPTSVAGPYLTRLWLGIARTGLADTPPALEDLSAYLQAASACGPDRYLKPLACYMVAVNKVYRREWAAAVPWYAEAASGFAAAGRHAARARSLAEATWCLLRLQRDGEAQPYLEWLDHYCVQYPGDQHMRHAWLVGRALYCRLRDYLALSTAYCRSLLASGRGAVSPRHRSEAAWIAGRNQLDLGRIDLAALLAEHALEQAGLARWTFLVNQAHQLRLQVARSRSRRTV